MNINWKVRVKNVYFWIGLIGVILTAVGANPAMLTSWTILVEQVKAAISNPFLIGCTIVAVIGYINDPTTSGLSDSKQALQYFTPKKDTK